MLEKIFVVSVILTLPDKKSVHQINGKIHPHSEETKQKISIANKGNYVSDTCKLATSNRFKNISKTEEHKKKIALGNTGKFKSQATKDKISRTKKEKAYTPWNKGLTKETDERVQRYAESLSIATQGRVPWNKGKRYKINKT